VPKENWLDGIHLGMVTIRLAQQPALAGIKHSNRLEQVIARSQWKDGWGEAILLDDMDSVIEGTQSNLFVLKNGMLRTPDLSACGVVGVMRDYILANASRIGVATQIGRLTVADLEAADAILMCNSLIGIWPVKRFYGQEYENFKLSHKLLGLLRDDGVIPTH
jgi:4-amino-4-deoxychorismate lyase